MLCPSARTYASPGVEGSRRFIDPITLSAFRLHGLGTLDTSTVATLVCLALAANCLFKATLVLSVARRQLGRTLLPALGLMVAGLLLAALLA